jgi:hypothetical protein
MESILIESPDWVIGPLARGVVGSLGKAGSVPVQARERLRRNPGPTYLVGPRGGASRLKSCAYGAHNSG